jgi:hypothetical protein
MDTQELVTSNRMVGSDGWSLLLDNVKMLNDPDYEIICRALNIPPTTDAWTLAGYLQRYYWSEVNAAFSAAGRSLN